jgi:hypothetical protein
LRVLPADRGGSDASADVRSALQIADEIIAQGRDPLSRLNRLHFSQIAVQVELQSVHVSSEISSQTQQGGRRRDSDRDWNRDALVDCCGIGVAFVPTPSGQHLAVMRIAADCRASPASLVRVGDVVRSIDGSDVSGVPLPRVAKTLLGPAGSNVQIGFQSPGDPSVKAVQFLRLSSSPVAGKSASAHDRQDGRRDAAADRCESPGSVARPACALSDSPPDPPKPRGVCLDRQWGRREDPRSDDAGAIVGGAERDPPSRPDAGSGPDGGKVPHSIWGTIEDLDNAIETRVSDFRAFTQSIMRLKREAEETSKLFVAANAEPSCANPESP